MQHSTFGLGDPSARPPTSAFCVWQVPQNAVTIHLHLSTVEWLDREMTEVLRSPVKKSEVCGLLLGKTQFTTHRQITIEGFVPIAREEESAGSHGFSDADRRALKVEMTRWQPGQGKNLYVVGYYRSHNREGFCLDDEDLTLAWDYFSSSDCMFLLIKPSLTQTSVAGFFFVQHGDIKVESKLLFPFSRSRLAAGDTTLVGGPSDERVPSSEEPVALRSYRADPPAQTAASAEIERFTPEEDIEPLLSPSFGIPPATRRYRWLWILSIGLILAIGGVGYRNLRNAAQSEKTTAGTIDDLGLKVESEKDQLRVSWNKNSPWIVSAKTAVLSITDGSSTKYLNLDLELLQSGSVVYSPLSNDVTVRLHVSADKKSSESVRLVGGERFAEPLPTVPTAIEPTPNGSPTNVPRPEPAAASQSLRVRKNSDRAQKAPIRPSPTLQAEQKLQRSKTEPAELPRLEAEPAAQPNAAPRSTGLQSSAVPDRIGETSLRAGAEAAVKVAESPAAGPTPPPNSQVPDVPVASEKKAAAPQEVPAALTAQPSPAGRTGNPVVGADYVPPRPAHRVVPSFPSGSKVPGGKAIQVDVKVQIDDMGRVVRAEPISRGQHDSLLQAAVDAARQWRFSPARQGNQNVSSETVLQFQFGSGNK